MNIPARLRDLADEIENADVDIEETATALAELLTVLGRRIDLQDTLAAALVRPGGAAAVRSCRCGNSAVVDLKDLFPLFVDTGCDGCRAPIQGSAR